MQLSILTDSKIGNLCKQIEDYNTNLNILKICNENLLISISEWKSENAKLFLEVNNLREKVCKFDLKSLFSIIRSIS